MLYMLDWPFRGLKPCRCRRRFLFGFPILFHGYHHVLLGRLSSGQTGGVSRRRVISCSVTNRLCYPHRLGIFWYVTTLYSFDILLLNSQFIAYRLAATLGAKGRRVLTKKTLLDCDITEACEKILNPPAPIALRTSAGLMMGVVK